MHVLLTTILIAALFMVRAPTKEEGVNAETEEPDNAATRRQKIFILRCFVS